MSKALFMAAAAAGAAAKTYVDDVFSTWLYAGNGSSQTITNGIDLAGEAGLVWMKSRTTGGEHSFFDTMRGPGRALVSSSTGADRISPGGADLTSFGGSGFSLGASFQVDVNSTGANYASWTFRKAPKFFDVVTWTGNASNRTIAHDLGVAPGCIMVKRTDTTSDWQVYHRITGNANYLVLNTTAASAAGSTRWNSTSPTSSVFSLGTDSSVNANGGTYVAYLFAHDTDPAGLIQCGFLSTDSNSDGTVTLGWEPQWVLYKRFNATGDWVILDTLRGYPGVDAANSAQLLANTSGAENTASDVGYVTTTGFVSDNVTANGDFVYIAIRRPNKPPTVGTQVFAPVARTGTGAAGTSTAFGQVTDLVFTKARSSTETWAWTDRLRGATRELTSAANTAETAYANDVAGFDTMTGFRFGTGASGQINTNATTYIDNLFRRAPGFFDVVAYMGGSITHPHNLGSPPEMIIAKARGLLESWYVYHSALGNESTLILNSDVSTEIESFEWALFTPDATKFRVAGRNNFYEEPYIAYLFATLPGISKVGSYIGNGSSQTINCGFTTGARFVLIKRTDAAGDWFVWDTARGIVSGNDPHLRLNTTAAEVTTNDSIDPDTSGFIVNQVAATNINVNGGQYIFLAIA